MKKQLSVFMLFLASRLKMTIYLIIGCFVVNIAAAMVMNYEMVPAICSFIFFLSINFIAILCVHRDEEKAAYTLLRLKTNDKECFYLQWIANILIISIIWLANILAVSISLSINPFAIGGQNLQKLFLPFYGNNTLNTLLPLENYLMLIKNILMVISMGALISAINTRNHYSKNATDYFWLYSLTIFNAGGVDPALRIVQMMISVVGIIYANVLIGEILKKEKVAK